MRKLLVLATLIMVLTVSSTASAEIKRHLHNVRKGPPSLTLEIGHIIEGDISTLTTNVASLMILTYLPQNKLYHNITFYNAGSRFVFSVVQPPKFELYRDDKLITTLVFKNVSGAGTYFSYDRIRISEWQPILQADKIYLILPTKDGTIEKIELPEDFLKDWQYVITADYKTEVQKALSGTN